MQKWPIFHTKMAHFPCENGPFSARKWPILRAKMAHFPCKNGPFNPFSDEFHGFRQLNGFNPFFHGFGNPFPMDSQPARVPRGGAPFSTNAGNSQRKSGLGAREGALSGALTRICAGNNQRLADLAGSHGIRLSILFRRVRRRRATAGEGPAGRPKTAPHF